MTIVNSKGTHELRARAARPEFVNCRTEKELAVAGQAEILLTLPKGSSRKEKHLSSGK